MEQDAKILWLFQPVLPHIPTRLLALLQKQAVCVSTVLTSQDKQHIRVCYSDVSKAIVICRAGAGDSLSSAGLVRCV